MPRRNHETLAAGDRVTYEPYDGAPLEHGTLTRFSADPSLAFVLYDAQRPDASPQATPIHRLRRV